MPFTRNALAALRNLIDRKALAVADRQGDLSRPSLRSTPKTHVLWVDQLNICGVLKPGDVVFAASGLDASLGKGEGKSK